MFWSRSLLASLVLLFAVSAYAQPAVRTQTGAQALCGSTTNGNDVTLTYASVSAGDITILFGGHGDSSDFTSYGPVTSGYTAIEGGGSPFTTGPAFGVWWKKQGSTPDTNVVGEGGANASHGVAYCVFVLNGATVDSELPIDPEPTTLSFGSCVGCVPNCGGISGSEVFTVNSMLVCVAANIIIDTSIGTVTSYTSFNAGTAGNDADDITIGGVYRVIATQGFENPDAWSTWTSANGHNGAFVIRPARTPCRRTLTGAGC